MYVRPNFSARQQPPHVFLLAIALLASPLARGQSSTTLEPQSPPAKTQAAPTASSAQTQPEKQPETAPAPAQASTATTRAEGGKQAWTMLRDAAASSRPDMRVQAVTALGTMTTFPEARKLVDSAFPDPDLDVRVAAIVAVQAAKERSMIPELRKALDDKSPEVSFAAAVALWRMGNYAGNDILFEVLNGDRKAGSGFISSNLHTANKDLHSPSTLAAIGAKQGAYMLLGPFGVGLDALDYIRKGNNGNSARVLAISLLSEKRNNATRDQLVAALGDKDAFVRAAAAHALGNYHTRKVTDTLLDTFGDSKSGVRLMAAASYIRSANVRTSGHLVASAAKPPAKGAH